LDSDETTQLPTGSGISSVNPRAARTQGRRPMSEQSFTTHAHAHYRQLGVLARLVTGLLAVMAHTLEAERLARTDGVLQRLDPRLKMVGTLSLIVAAVQSRKLLAILAIFTVGVILAWMSHVPLRTLATRVWISVLSFTGVLVLPAMFLVPGDALYRLPLLGWTITAQGLGSAAYLVARAQTTATLALLLILCTPWTHVLKALRVLRVPVVLVVILAMTYRYVFLLLRTAQDMFEARQSRMVGRLEGPEQRRLIASSAGVLLDKTFHLSHEVYLAMQSRGFRGDVYTLDEFRMQPGDWAGLFVLLILVALTLWLGR
jgi:cobalt/nickel transport system permease protein